MGSFFALMFKQFTNRSFLINPMRLLCFHDVFMILHSSCFHAPFYRLMFKSFDIQGVCYTLHSMLCVGNPLHRVQGVALYVWGYHWQSQGVSAWQSIPFNANRCQSLHLFVCVSFLFVCHPVGYKTNMGDNVVKGKNTNTCTHTHIHTRLKEISPFALKMNIVSSFQFKSFWRDITR